MIDDRLERIERAYVAADDLEDATVELVWAAIYEAVPDATSNEIFQVVSERSGIIVEIVGPRRH